MTISEIFKLELELSSNKIFDLIYFEDNRLSCNYGTKDLHLTFFK